MQPTRSGSTPAPTCRIEALRRIALPGIKSRCGTAEKKEPEDSRRPFGFRQKQRGIEQWIRSDVPNFRRRDAPAGAKIRHARFRVRFRQGRLG